MKTRILLLSIATALPTAWSADDAAPRPRDGDRPPAERRDGDRPRNPDAPRDGERPRGDGGPRGERPPMFGMMPLLQPLDADDDGIISADEIKNSPAALKKLDRNNDGQISREEWMPQPPRGAEGERRGGPREGDRPQRPAGEGERDGQKPQGERPPDGERLRGERPRDGEAKAPERRPDRPQGQEQAEAGERRDRAPGPGVPPLVAALDLDGDGNLSTDEIGKAPESLAKLDRNNDGQLGPREYGPRPPEGGDREKLQPKP